ncbi:hypothetical protein NC652_024195 [Populus alba x Populus x berolinensis]|nr:hypothetical protein NC652_024195 [Populus alba x Populus x berolinensis]
MRPIRLPEPPSPTLGVPEIFENGAYSVIRRAVVIGNGFPGSENQSLGLIHALGLADNHVLYRVTRPSGGINEWLRWLPVSLHKILYSIIMRIYSYSRFIVSRGKKLAPLPLENRGSVGLSSILEADSKQIVEYGSAKVNEKQPQQKRPPRPPPPTALGFGDDDEDDVEKEISRQAAKNKSLKDSKYIKTLMGKAEERKRQHDVIFEKNLAKERSKEDHLFADKDKFVTAAYKRKLAEQEKWMEEERLRELREQKEDVTKKSDLSDFYFNLGKNVALGAKDLLSKKQEKQDKQSEFRKPEKPYDEVAGETSDRNHAPTDSKFALDSSSVKEAHQKETSPPRRSSEPLDPEPVSDKPVSGTSTEVKNPAEQSSANQLNPDHHKRNQDALAAAKERFLARKKAKQQ